jgi:molybdate transport system substrate-binding protein
VRRSAVLVTAALLLAGCASGTTAQSTSAAGGHGELSGTLTVLAASSLTDVFERLGGDFREAHPKVDLRINYGPSSGLAQSIVHGAPADVFASANQAQMTVVSDAHLATDPAVFASNVLEIAVPPGNPGHVIGLADFARRELTLAVCAPQVPCGAAAAQVFRAAGVHAVPDSQEEDARAALNKVELGEVDAALVYVTDVQAAGPNVRGIEFPEAGDAVNQYPITVLKDAPNPRTARAFVDLVRSPAGQRALAAAGFRAP